MSQVAVVLGEDASPEAMEPAVALLARLAPTLHFTYPPVGAAGLAAHGDAFPQAARRMFDAADAALFGATSGGSARALFYLRWGRQTFANVRPARWTAGYASPLSRPEGMDLVIVRENLEDLYVAAEGDLQQLEPLALKSRTWGAPVSQLGPGRFALKVITVEGSTRLIRYTFELARRRKQTGRPGKVTVTQKHNMLPATDGLFKQIAETVAPDYPDIAFEALIVDDFAHRLVKSPQSFDVVATPNLYGDILSDAAAGVLGGLGLAPSGCYGADFAYFEPAHGTAPDLKGRGIVNPTATLLSGAMMLEYLNLNREADKLRHAIDQVYLEGRWLTPDQNGRASTNDFCDEVEFKLNSVSR